MSAPQTRSGIPHIAVPTKSQVSLDQSVSTSPISTTSTASASGVSSNGSSPPVSPAESLPTEFEPMGTSNSAFKAPGAVAKDGPSVSGRPAAGSAAAAASATRGAKRTRSPGRAAAAASEPAQASSVDSAASSSILTATSKSEERPRKRTSLVNISTDSARSENEAPPDLGSPHKTRNVRPVISLGQTSGEGIKSGPGLGSPRATKATDDAFITSSPRKIHAIRKIQPFPSVSATASGPPPTAAPASITAKSRDSLSSIASSISATSATSAGSHLPTHQGTRGGALGRKMQSVTGAASQTASSVASAALDAVTSTPNPISRRMSLPMSFTTNEAMRRSPPLPRRASSPRRRAQTPEPVSNGIFSPGYRFTPDLDLSQTSQSSQGRGAMGPSSPQSPPRLAGQSYTARPVSAASSRSTTPALAPVSVRSVRPADSAAVDTSVASEAGSVASQELGVKAEVKPEAALSPAEVARAHFEKVTAAEAAANQAAAAAIAAGESTSMVMETNEEMPYSQPGSAGHDSSYYNAASVAAPGTAAEPLEGFAPDVPADSSLDASYVSATTALAAHQQQYVNDSTTSVAEEDAEMGDYEEEFDPLAFIYTLPPLPYEVISRPAALPPKTNTSPPNSLILDLDETLVHCSTEPLPGHDLTFPVEFNGAVYTVYVRKRPHLYEFLEAVSSRFEVSVFTASQRVYADALLNILDPAKTHIKHRLFRDHCVNVEGNYLKDLNILGRDLARVMIVDNSPQAFGYQIDNGIPIETWYEDPNDTGLLDLIPLLEQAAVVDDVRPLLKQTFDLRSLVIQAGKESGVPRGGGSV